MTTVNVALLCIFTVIMCGYLNYIDKENAKIRTQKHRRLIDRLEDNHKEVTDQLEESDKHHRETYEKAKKEACDKFDVLVMIFQEICKETKLSTPFPVRLTKGHTNEDFATMVQIVHWNGQWRDDNNTSLSPSVFLQCPKDLPRPMHYKEWQRLAKLFYEESGLNLFIPDYTGEEKIENSRHPTLDVNQIDEQQLCRTPVCFSPNLMYEGKESKCHYCMSVCCNCINCERYRGFFKIRTTLINTGRTDKWDYQKIQLERSINMERRQHKEGEMFRNIMRALFQQARERNPTLPMSLIYLEDDNPLKEKLKKIALRMINNPLDKIITADERVNRLADNLSEEIIKHFLATKQLQRQRTQDIMKWLMEQYHEEEELTKGGSDVVVNSDHNMFQRSPSLETEGSSVIFLPQWINPDSDEGQNVSVENGDSLD